jgi:hypothetical protein
VGIGPNGNSWGEGQATDLANPEAKGGIKKDLKDDVPGSVFKGDGRAAGISRTEDRDQAQHSQHDSTRRPS